jgi:molybdopterin converting factor small subunit
MDISSVEVDMPVLKIPAPLRTYTDGKTELMLAAETAGGVLEALVAAVPALRPHLLMTSGKPRNFVHLFVNDQDIQYIQGWDTPLTEDDRLALVVSIAGG